MASLVVIRLTCLALICMVLGALLTEGALTCGQVQNAVLPCASYLITGGPTVPGACCSGIRSLNSAANTTPARQTACRCIVSAVKSLPTTLNPSVLSSLPAKCGVSLPYQISPDIDCSKVR